MRQARVGLQVATSCGWQPDPIMQLRRPDPGPQVGVGDASLTKAGSMNFSPDAERACHKRTTMIGGSRVRLEFAEHIPFTHLALRFVAGLVARLMRTGAFYSES